MFVYFLNFTKLKMQELENMHNMYNRQNVIKSSSFYPGSHGRLRTRFREQITPDTRDTEDNTDYVREENILTRQLLIMIEMSSVSNFIS